MIVENVSKILDCVIQVVRRIKIVKIKEFGFEGVEKTLDGRVVGWTTGTTHALNYADRLAK